MSDDVPRPSTRRAFDIDHLVRRTARGVDVPFPPASDRRAWDGVDAVSRASILERAAALSGQPWPPLTVSARLELSRSGSRRAFEAPYFARRRRLMMSALALALGDEEYADAVLDGLGVLLEETSWCLPAHDSPPGGALRRLPDPDRPVLDLFAAETAATLTWVTWLHADRLADTPELLAQVRNAVLDRVFRPFVADGPNSWWFGAGMNWNPWIVSNVLTATALLAPSEDVTRATYAAALESLDGYLDRTPSDGGCAEGLMYWWLSAARLYEALDVLGWLSPEGSAAVLTHPLVQRMARYPLVVHLGGAWSASLADGIARVPGPDLEIDKDQHPPALLHRFATAAQVPEVAALAASFDRSYVPYQAMYRSLVTLFDPGWTRSARTAEPAATTHWLDQTQVFAASTDDARVRVVAKGGHNDEPHNHLDVGSVVVAVDGAPVLIDVGAGQYTAASFGPDRYSAWFTQSGFHTVPAPDGAEQGVGERFRAAVLEQSADHVRMELAGAYPPSVGITSWQREVRPGAVLELTESWIPATSDARVHLMLAHAPQDNGDGSFDLRDADGRGRARLEIGDHVEAAVEPIDLTDPILTAVWGDQIARLVLRPRETAVEGSLRVILRAL
ncbi:heparinase II/III family protein [Ruania alba]|uniref:Heparinase II/III-like protein n=1 Tax=Ruania alba TaxID=648782 RepID=A0A1H5G6V4_9MICO|nr:heparinase II/III family protein [Ruania alba]SEE11407.1 Heparinase II/III-like protein [Ruania alba]